MPPQEKMPESSSTDFELVTADDCVVAPEGTSGDVALIYTKLEEDLIAQIKVNICAQQRQRYIVLAQWIDVTFCVVSTELGIQVILAHPSFAQNGP